MSHLNIHEQDHFNSQKFYAIPFVVELIVIQLLPDVFNLILFIFILKCLILIPQTAKIMVELKFEINIFL